MKRICVFCGSNSGARASYAEAARRTGQTLAREGIAVVYGGGRVGLMGAVADAALAAGGEVIGIIPQALEAREVAHQGVTELHIVGSMHERKALMAELSDAFIALPGGYGTFEEFCEVLTWAQLGLQRKPCGLLNVDGYYDPLLALFDRAVTEQFVRPIHRSLVLVESGLDQLLSSMTSYRPPALDKWIQKDET
ncbi:MAG TPA: TIGR00730 family Rossman fold protein [Pyrinomonadaceae bacterium]